MIKPPLPNSELKAIFKEVEKKTHKFTTELFLNYVNATREERKEFYKDAISKRQQKRDKKAAKYNEVIELFKCGHSKSAIARELNMSRTTVIKIIRESL